MTKEEGCIETIKMENKEDIEIKFWEDWLEADSLEREKLVENLLLVKKPIASKNKELDKHSRAIIINSYFEDLEAVLTDKLKEERKIKN